ncbi:MAG: hypothetical protein LQ345_007443 [Seirophora villosa]|nr:MAG: hypothetical protein LQ345_007443 [Seirophora villosa]
MPKIFITNESAHPQTFKVHGWNKNRNITIPPHSTSTISAPDKSSGAIIALHDGQEGEQAEITFNGFGGNDFIDISNIVGAGGNLTIQQQGEPTTRKGDPLFMQHLRAAWSKAPQHVKNELKGSVFTDKNGKAVRIGPIKDHPKLEEFVRSFADGKTYIGVGAWNGSPGNPLDNAQSSAAHGTKNAIITYSDEDATPGRQGGNTAHRTLHENQAHMADHVLGQQRSAQHGAAEDLAAPNPHERAEQHGPGIDLRNKSGKACTYFFYDNYWNGNGTAGANFDHPLKSVHLAAHASHFVPLPATFKGRVQRGTLIPATWAEFQLDASNDHAAHGDISLQQGCDGAATIASTDGSHRIGGFENDILTHAPEKAMVKRKDGMRVLASTMGNWMAGPNEAAAQWEFKMVGQKKAYIKGGSGTDDVASKNQRLAVTFF